MLALVGVAALAAAGSTTGVAPAVAAPQSSSPASTYAVISTIGLGYNPHGVAVSNDDTVYVTVKDGLPGDDSTVVINPGSLVVDNTTPVGGEPLGVAVSSDDTVYVGNFQSNTLSVLRGQSAVRSLGLPGVPGQQMPQGVAVDSDDSVYVAQTGNTGRLLVMDTHNLDDSIALPVGSGPFGVAVNAPDDSVYVTMELEDTLRILGGAAPRDDSILVGVGDRPLGVAVNETDDTVYVANANSNTLTVLSGQSPRDDSVTIPINKVPTLPCPPCLVVNAIPRAVAVDDSTLYDTVFVVNERGFVTVMDARQLDDSVSVSVGISPFSVAVRSDGTAYVTNNQSKSVSVIAKVEPTLATVSGDGGSRATVTLSVPGGYAADDTTVKTVTFGTTPGTLKSQTGTNEWQVTVPAGSGTVPVTVTFNGGLTASAGSFTYNNSPSPNPVPVYPPGAPTAAAATAGNGSATVTWTAPTDSGSFPITHYQAVSSPSGGTCLASAPVTSCEVTGLTNGTTYTFAVRALNGAGWGDFSSASNPVRPTGATPAPAPVPVPPLEPGQSQLVVDGKVTPVQVDANSRSDGLMITGDDFSMNLTGLGRDGKPLNLSPDGALILNEDRQVDTSGSGFQAASEVDLHIDPPILVTTSGRSARAAEATYVGTLVTDGKGSFAGRPTLPAGIAAGKHILQAVGLTSKGLPRAMSLGVLVTADASITLIKGTRTKDGRHDRINATGTTTEVPAGTKLVPYIQYRGQGSFAKGKASIVVQADGTFTWSRRVLSSKSIAAFVAWDDIASNRVVWARVR